MSQPMNPDFESKHDRGPGGKFARMDRDEAEITDLHGGYQSPWDSPDDWAVENDIYATEEGGKIRFHRPGYGATLLVDDPGDPTIHDCFVAVVEESRALGTDPREMHEKFTPGPDGAFSEEDEEAARRWYAVNRFLNSETHAKNLYADPKKWYEDKGITAEEEGDGYRYTRVMKNGGMKTVFVTKDGRADSALGQFIVGVQDAKAADGRSFDDWCYDQQIINPDKDAREAFDTNRRLNEKFCDMYNDESRASEIAAYEWAKANSVQGSSDGHGGYILSRKASDGTELQVRTTVSPQFYGVGLASHHVLSQAHEVEDAENFGDWCDKVERTSDGRSWNDYHQRLEDLPRVKEFFGDAYQKNMYTKTEDYPEWGHDDEFDEDGELVE